jgi:hypothetical protein
MIVSHVSNMDEIFVEEEDDVDGGTNILRVK